MKSYLYRGISEESFKKSGAKLIPKKEGDFNYTFHYGEFKYGSGVTYGKSQKNAVIRHQLRQEGFPTSGISTTPHMERAKYYATSGYKNSKGYILVINRNILNKYGIKEHYVADSATCPSVPEDDEIILVSENGKALPEDVIHEIIEINIEK